MHHQFITIICPSVLSLERFMLDSGHWTSSQAILLPETLILYTNAAPLPPHNCIGYLIHSLSAALQRMRNEVALRKLHWQRNHEFCKIRARKKSLINSTAASSVIMYVCNIGTMLYGIVLSVEVSRYSWWTYSILYWPQLHRQLVNVTVTGARSYVQRWCMYVPRATNTEKYVAIRLA